MKRATIVVFLVVLTALSAYSVTDAPLKLQRTIVLSGVTGKFDHFAMDETKDRLFAAATGNQTVEMIDLSTGKSIQSLSGFGKPHGLAWIAETGRLFVADGSKAELDVLEGLPLKIAKRISLSEDADDMVYDDAHKMLYVGHGGTNAANPAAIAVVDATSLELIKDLPVGSHPEALELDANNDRIFANISDRGELVVIDGKTQTQIGTWPLTDVKGNTPLAYDAADNLLLVGCRTPSKLLVLDGKTGKTIASASADAGADDLFYEPRTHRAYLVTGSGSVDTYVVSHDGKLQVMPPTSTATGAKTGLLAPSQGTLFVGIPGTNAPSQVRMYLTGAK